MFKILNNCCAYFCPWLYNDTTDCQSEISDATTIDGHMPYHSFNAKPTFCQTNPLVSSKMTRG